MMPAVSEWTEWALFSKVFEWPHLGRARGTFLFCAAGNPEQRVTAQSRVEKGEGS